MNRFIKNILRSGWLLFTGGMLYAQEQEKAIKSLDEGRLEPYKMEVTYNKTSHLLFPSAIKYVDLGSDYLVADKTEVSSNVLRIKSSVRDFDEETNFSVITEDGKFYSFDVSYSNFPLTLSYDLLQLQRNSEKSSGSPVRFEELGEGSPSLTDLVMKTIASSSRRTINHLGSRNYGIQVVLSGVYIHQGKLYFRLDFKNETNIPFPIDFVNFKVADKRSAKRTVLQEKTISPIRMLKSFTEIPDNSSQRNIYLLDQFTITDDQVLLIEIFEKEGIRHQKIEVENADLLGAQLVKDMKLKLK